VKLRCANCHNHPLDRWTQDDYHGLAAVFAKVRRGRVVTLDPRGEVTHAGTGRPARPRIPGERFLDTADGSGREDVDARAVFAAWLTARSNPWFAKAIVNRLWKTLMGRGLVEPVDDHRATNPPTHPGLLNRLAEDFRQHGYRIRHTLRLIAASHAYARASVAQPSHTVRHTSSPKYSDGPDTPERVGRLINRSDDQYYSRSLVRKLPPAVLVDAVCDVTGIPEKFGNQPVGTHAVQLFDPRIPSMTLDILGRCDRSGSCESGTPSGSGLATKLHWINGRFLNRKIIHPEGRLRQLTSSGATDSDIVHDFYLRALSRPPTVRESGFWKTQLANRQTIGERQRALEDFLWSLLSCRAFRTR